MSDLTAQLVATSVVLIVGLAAWHLIGFSVTVVALLSWLIGSQAVRA